MGFDARTAEGALVRSNGDVRIAVDALLAAAAAADDATTILPAGTGDADERAASNAGAASTAARAEKRRRKRRPSTAAVPAEKTAMGAGKNPATTPTWAQGAHPAQKSWKRSGPARKRSSSP